MTVRELIAHLQALPQDSVVLYRMCSDYEELHSEEVVVVPASEKRFVLRNGLYSAYQDYHDKYPPGEEPVFVGAVIFPGN